MSLLVHQVKDETDLVQKKQKLSKIHKIFNKIRSEYLSLERQPQSLKLMRRKYDLIEAFSVGLKDDLQAVFREHSLTPLQRIRSEEVLQQIRNVSAGSKKPLEEVQCFKEKEILLVEYQNIQKAVQYIGAEKKASRIYLTGPQLARKLKKVLKVEHVPFGKSIDFLYAHHFPGRDALNRTVTAYCEWKFNSPKKVADVQRTLQFFRNLHIRPETQFRGELYSFSEVFGYGLEEPRTYAESFGRTIVSDMLEKMLHSYHEKQQEVRRTLRDPTAQVICSNSFNRTSIHEVGRGESQKKFAITGKVLESSQENVEAAKKETSYAGRFLFSVNSLLGKELPNPSATAFPGAIQDRSLLKQLTSFVDGNEALLVVQRLAPEDIVV